MLAYLMRRLAFSLFGLFFLLTMVFIMVRAVPGDPARSVAGPGATAKQVEKARHELGLDKPYITQYFLFLKQLFHGDLGKSIVTNRPVFQDLKQRLPASAELAAVASIFGILIGLPIGTLAAVKWGTLFDHVGRVIGVIGIAVPTFWLGLLLQVILYRYLGWFPIGRQTSMEFFNHSDPTKFVFIDSLIAGNWPLLVNYIWHIILPALCLCQSTIALFARVFRASLLEVLNQDFIRTARSKGLHEIVIIGKHAARNAFIPILSILGIYWGLMIGNAILIETIFSWPGIGTYVLRAVNSFDYQGLMGGTLALGTVFFGANLLVDILHGIVDPTLRYT